MISQDCRASPQQLRDLWSLSLQAIYGQKQAYVRAFSSRQAKVYEWPLITEEKEGGSNEPLASRKCSTTQCSRRRPRIDLPLARVGMQLQADVLARLPQVV
jgi:hypothetical protein